MKKSALLLPFSLLLVASGSPSTEPRQVEPFFKDSTFLLKLDGKTFSSMGLDKLSEEELGRLCGAVEFAPYFPAGSYLDLEAARYLEQDGWRPVQVIGAYTEDPDRANDLLLLVADGYEVLALDPFGAIDPLPAPGLHWGKNVLSSWDILLPDGTKRHFSAKS